MVISLQQSASDLHMVQLMPLPPRHLCFSKIQNGLSMLYWPTWVVLDKGPLNDSSSTVVVVVVVRVFDVLCVCFQLQFTSVTNF